LLCVALGCAGGQPAESITTAKIAPPAVPWAVDHIIIGIDSLDRGIALVGQLTGVTPVYGGVHPGAGTRNALIALDHGRYLEIMAPNPEGGTAGDAHTGSFAALRTPTPIGWAVRTGNADSVRAAMVRRGLNATPVAAGARQTPTGTTLRWRTFDPFGSERDVLPFLIEWDPATMHPSTSSPSGCSLASLTILSPQPDSLQRLFDRAGMPVTIRSSARESIVVSLDCPAGRVTLP
jgi:hypothetical protein